MHDWTRVDAGIYHDFHLEWISQLKRALNERLPSDYYAAIAYECADNIRAYIEPLAVGDAIPDMPVFLYPEMHVQVPLEATYQAAWQAVPRRWQAVIAPPR